MQLTMTLVRGVSEREIAWVVRQGVYHRNVRLVAMLPAFFSGRYQLDPDPLDRIIGLSRPQHGAPPAELNDPRNYLVFDRLPSAGALADGATVFTTDRDGRPAVSDPATVLGVVVGAVEPVTPEYIASALADTGRDGSAYIPDWIAVSGMPTLAPGVERPRLVRRNGTRVRPEWAASAVRLGSASSRTRARLWSSRSGSSTRRSISRRTRRPTGA